MSEPMSIEEKLAVGFLTLCLAFIGYAAYGYLMKRESLVVQVIDKQSQVTVEQVCADEDDNDNTCRRWKTETTTTYKIFTPGETFVTTKALYDEIVVGKKHHITAAGWKNRWMTRTIVEVLE